MSTQFRPHGAEMLQADRQTDGRAGGRDGQICIRWCSLFELDSQHQILSQFYPPHITPNSLPTHHSLSNRVFSKYLPHNFIIFLHVRATSPTQQATGAQRGSRDIALLFHDLGTRRGWVIVTPQLPLLPRKTRYPLYRRLGGPQGRSGRVRKISPAPGFDPRTVQPVASRCTVWAIAAPTQHSLLD